MNPRTPPIFDDGILISTAVALVYFGALIAFYVP